MFQQKMFGVVRRGVTGNGPRTGPVFCRIGITLRCRGGLCIGQPRPEGDRGNDGPLFSQVNRVAALLFGPRLTRLTVGNPNAVRPLNALRARP